MLQCHPLCNSVHLLLPADKVVVGVSSDAVLERNPAVSPSNQLAQATEYLDVGAKSSEICFSFDVCNTTNLFSLALMPGLCLGAGWICDDVCQEEPCSL